MSEPRIVRVSDVMETSVHRISGLSNVREAIVEMNRHRVSSLVIDRRDDDDEYGVITVRDIAAHVVARNRSTVRTSVYEIMTKPAMTLDSEMNIKYAMRLLSRFHLTRALVTHGKDLLGIVTLRDMVLGYLESTDSTPESGDASD